MRTATCTLGIALLGGIAASAAAQQGVVYIGDVESVDRAIVEAADLSLPNMSLAGGVATRPNGPAVPPATIRSRPTPAPRMAPPKPEAPAEESRGFFSRLKPRWPFGGKSKPAEPTTDPFLEAKQSSRAALVAGRPATSVTPIPTHAQGGVAPVAYETRPANGRSARPGATRSGALPLREAKQPSRGLLSGLWGGSKPEAKPAPEPRRVAAQPVGKPKPASAAPPQLFTRRAPTVTSPVTQAKPTPSKTRLGSTPRGMPREWGVAAATPQPKPTLGAARPTASDADGVFVTDASSPKPAARPSGLTKPSKPLVVVSRPKPTPPAAKVDTDLPLVLDSPVSASPASEASDLAVVVAGPASTKPSPVTKSNPQTIVMPEPAAPVALAPTPTAAYPMASPTSEPVAAPLVVASDTGSSGSSGSMSAAADQEPSPRSQSLLMEAHELAQTAETADAHTAIIQRCRYVLAIDRSKIAAAYANQLAAWSLNKRGEAMESAGEPERARSDYLDALRCDAECWRAEYNLALIAARSGDREQAHRRFTRTIAVQPEHAEAYASRASLELTQGRLEQSLADYQTAIEIDPDMASAHQGRGRVCHMLGRLDEALRHLDAAAILAPNDTVVASARGDLLMDLGRYGQARDAYQQAIALAPSRPVAYRNLAWLQATCPVEAYRDGESALINVNRAAELFGEDDDLTLDTRAAALAALGRFDEAKPVQEQAIEQAPQREAAVYRERLAMYERGESFVTSPVRPASYVAESTGAEVLR